MFGLMVLASLVGLILFKPAATAAATNNTINFQARLEQASGAIAPDGNYNVEFKLYSASSGGTALWTEDWLNSASNGIHVANGYLTANLGSITAFPTNIDWSQQLWLTMNIGGVSTGTPTWDGEMNPRLQVTSVPYAFRAGQATQLVNTAGSYTSSLSLLQPSGGNQTFQVKDQGASGTYNLCVQGATAGNGGCAPTTGGSGYIQNGTSVQTSTSFFIQPSSGNVGGVIEANGSGDLLRLDNSSAQIVTKFNSNGDLIIGSANASNSTTAFEVQNNSTNLLIQGDTSNMSVGIAGASTTAGYALNITGSLNASNGIYDGGVRVCTNTGCAPASGSSNYIQNLTTLQPGSTSFYIQPGSGNVGGVIEANGADALDIQNAGGNVISEFNASGYLGLNTLTASNKLTVNSATTTDSLAQALIATGSAGNRGIVIQGSFGQSQSLLQLQDSTGAVLSTFDASGNLGIGTSTLGGYKLNVNGSANAQTLYQNGYQVCDSSSNCNNYAPSAGSGYYINNSPGLETNANIHISSSGTSNVTAAFQDISSQSADLLELQNAGGNVLSTFNANGDLQVGGVNSAGSATALHVENGNGVDIFTVNSTPTGNLVGNGSFETGTNGWTPSGSDTITQTSANAYSGQYSAYIYLTNSDKLSYPVNLQPNTTYTLSIDYIPTTTGSNANICWNDGGGGSGCGASLQSNASTTYWSNLSYTFTTSSTVSSPYIYFQEWSGQAARNWYVDAIQVVPGSSAPVYSEGSFQLNGTLTSPLAIQPPRNATGLAVMNTNGSSVFSVNTAGNGSINLGSGTSIQLSAAGSITQRTNNVIGISTSLGLGNAYDTFYGTGSTASLMASSAIFQGNSGIEIQTGNISGQTYGVKEASLGSNGNIQTYGGSTTISGLTAPTISTTSTGSAYYYCVTAVNANGESGCSTAVGMANNTSNIAWSSVMGATSYNLYRKAGNNNFTSGAVLISTLSSSNSGFLTPSKTDTGAAGTSAAPPTTVTGSGLTVQGWTGQTGAALLVQDASSNSLLKANGSVSSVNVGYNSASAVLYVASDGSTGRSINAAGSINASGADYAEYYYQKMPGSLQAGEVVCLTGSQMVAACGTSGAGSTIIGAVSSHPGYVGNDLFDASDPSKTALVGMLGQIPVNFSNEAGAIAAGDAVTYSADQPGKIIKASGAGQILGFALDSSDASSSGQITVLVRPQEYTPASATVMQGSSAVLNALTLNGGLSAQNINIGELATLGSLRVTGSADVQGNLNIGGTLSVTGNTYLANLYVNGHLLTAGNTPLIAKGSAAGQDGTVTIDGTDSAGTITITVKAHQPTAQQAQTGMQPEALGKGDLADVTFAQNYQFTPRVVLSPDNAETVGLPVYVEKTEQGYKVIISSAAGDGKTYQFDYLVLGSQGNPTQSIALTP